MHDQGRENNSLMILTTAVILVNYDSFFHRRGTDWHATRSQNIRVRLYVGCYYFPIIF